MENVDPVQKECFLCSFRATIEAIPEGLSASRATSANTHWTIWSDFCDNMALHPLLMPYREPILILDTLAAK